MSPPIKIYLLKFLFLLFIIPSINLQESKKTFKELVDLYLTDLKINNAYLSYDQYISLLNTLQKTYPNHLELSSIGKTFEGNEMPLIIMKSPFVNQSRNQTTFSEKKNTKSAILFTGMHHGREPVSMMMNIYLILHLLSISDGYLHLLLSSTEIFFVPIINIDSYKYNCENYLTRNVNVNNLMSRKNRNPFYDKEKTKVSNCRSDDIGVDLNRNYDYAFGNDNVGSSPKECEEDFRGPYPFSEPETQNIKNFTDKHPNIKICINFHSWGNLIITPFNYLKSKISEDSIKKNYPLHYKMYQDFLKEANYPDGFLFGNGDETIKYTTNGDATDWFFGAKKILSFSPELGVKNKESDVFYPSRKITFEILEKNLYNGLYAIQKSAYFLKAELISADYSKCLNKNKYYTTREKYYANLKDYEMKNCRYNEMLLNIKIKVKNEGFADYIPGLEFPPINNVYLPNTISIEINQHKRIFHFLPLDLKINTDSVKSFCYWPTLTTLYSVEKPANFNFTKMDFNYTDKDMDETQYIGRIRCYNSETDKLKSDLKIFMDNIIKAQEFIILNFQIILKKNIFALNVTENKFLGLNQTNNKKDTNSAKNNESVVFMKLYTKFENVIKTQNLEKNLSVIEWKFNNPEISVNLGNFIEMKNIKISKISKISLIKILIIFLSIILIIIICMRRMIRNLTSNQLINLLVNMNRRNENINNENNNNVGRNEERVVNNVESENRSVNNYSNDPVQHGQLPVDDSNNAQSLNISRNTNVEMVNQG